MEEYMMTHGWVEAVPNVPFVGMGIRGARTMNRMNGTFAQIVEQRW